jgi:hypothetical protein
VKDFHGSAAAHRRAIAQKPDFALAHRNLGNALFALKHFNKAIAAYRRAIELNPDFADAWSNLGTTLQHAGQYDEAMAALRRAIALAPEQQANGHSGLGILMLMHGDFAAGWEEYEWRLRSSEAKGPPFPQRPWQGESVAGRHIYVQAEQGFGDTIQFVRYLPSLRQRAGAVTVRVQQPLLTLVRESLPGITVIGDGETPAPADCECALLSLPRLFGTRLETVPAVVPYLHPHADIAAQWQSRLSAMQGIKVGLVWAGRSEHANDFRRSLGFDSLAPLLSVSGVDFASLQVGPRAADLKSRRGRKITDLSPQLEDFAATAGVVMALDLVITVDTAVAHLAGAIGKPVWVLLPWVTDWRWLLDREDNPWYPSMRLFRQRRGDTWPDVVLRVARELSAVARGHGNGLMATAL